MFFRKAFRNMVHAAIAFVVAFLLLLVLAELWKGSAELPKQGSTYRLLRILAYVGLSGAITGFFCTWPGDKPNKWLHVMFTVLAAAFAFLVHIVVFIQDLLAATDEPGRRVADVVGAGIGLTLFVALIVGSSQFSKQERTFWQMLCLAKSRLIKFLFPWCY